MKLLVIEDEVKIASLINRALTEASYTVRVALDAAQANDALDAEAYDLVILDLLIPGIAGGGIELCRQIRGRGHHLPILMLTALDSPDSKVSGLDAGADDYLTKPFNLDELLARIRALLRRAAKAQLTSLTIDDLTLEPATRRAVRGSRVIELTAKEYAVLDYLVRHAGRIVSQSELLEHAWDYEYDGLSNVVETYIRYVRKKLTAGGEPDIIETRRGAGYMIGKQA
ncbi:response regulator transcription factor [Candidatus Saccharibacteria bacterium]|nr:response regulator transcription factor [Candidatus Saccharibacteria bacterium]